MSQVRMVQVRMAQVEWRRCEKTLGTCAAIEMQISDYAVFIINVWRRSARENRTCAMHLEEILL
jgi:hypothetical protein